MTHVTLSTKYQVVIPKDIRRQAGLHKGTRLMALYKNGIITLIPQRPLKSLRGVIKGVDPRALREKKDRL